MPLREQFEAQGQLLFRWRSYPPLFVIALVVFELRNFRYPAGSHASDLAWEVICLTIALVGMGIRVVTVGHVPGGTSGRSTHSFGAAVLNVSGLYSVVRHPLYLGNFLMWLGPALLVRSVSVVLIVSLAFWLYYERIMFAEEEFLRQSFGTEYERWASVTPAFFPARTGWRPWAIPFSAPVALKRESSGFFALISVFAAVEVGSDLAVTGRIILDPVWVALFVASATLYVALRVAARRAALFSATGR